MGFFGIGGHKSVNKEFIKMEMDDISGLDRYCTSWIAELQNVVRPAMVKMHKNKGSLGSSDFKSLNEYSQVIITADQKLRTIKDKLAKDAKNNPKLGSDEHYKLVAKLLADLQGRDRLLSITDIQNGAESEIMNKLNLFIKSVDANIEILQRIIEDTKLIEGDVQNTYNKTAA